MTPDEYLDRFVRYLLVIRMLAENSVDAYARDIRAFLDAVDDPQGIDEIEIRNHIEKLHQSGLKPRSIGRMLSAIKAFF
ncbi:site-specific integrase, partial [bacterium]|nr:site-specific integrase [bacterium]